MLEHTTRPPRSAGADALRRHWDWRPDWTRQRPHRWWYLTFENDDRVQDLAARARSAIRPDAPVQPIPGPWLHLTLAEVGPLDGSPPDLAEECRRTAQQHVADLGGLDLEIEPVTTMPGAVVLPVSPDGLDAVYDRLLAAMRETLPAQPVQRRFNPHISVAYVDRPCRRADVLDEDLVDRCEPGRTHTDHVSLVDVTREESHYWWSTRRDVRLGAATVTDAFEGSRAERREPAERLPGPPGPVPTR